jgi:hypothetical protein
MKIHESAIIGNVLMQQNAEGQYYVSLYSRGIDIH